MAIIVAHATVGPTVLLHHISSPLANIVSLIINTQTLVITRTAVSSIAITDQNISSRRRRQHQILSLMQVIPLL